MNIQAINNRAFQAKFRIAILSTMEPEGDKIATTTRYKVYNSPQAKDIFEKAKNIKDPIKKRNLLSQMGMYVIEEETTYMDRVLPQIREVICKKRPE